jgi:hypothetical protein
MDTMDTNLKNLNNSLMFNLSLSSKELFHSNFLAYLFKKHNDLFCQIIGEANFTFDVKREHKNIDIEILGKNGKNIIVENKVKDVLKIEQFKKIDQLRNRDNYQYVILFSLLDNNLSSFEVNKKWTEIGYKKIIKVLSEYDYNDKYLEKIVKDYCDFVENMITLLDATIGNCNKYIFHNKNSDLQNLKDIRLHDVFIKYGMTRFANYFEKKYEDIKVTYGISRSMGTMSFSKVINGNDIGIQLENTQYRIYAVCDIDTRDKWARKGWFDINYRSRSNRPYLEYKDKDSNKKFWYQLKDENIIDMDFERLASIIYKDLSKIN